MTMGSADALARAEESLLRGIKNLLADEDAAETPSVPLRKLDQPEIGALRLVSWLYALYRESGRSALQFLEQSGAIQLRPQVDLVTALRTYFHHHLTDSSDDRATRARAELWFRDTSRGLADDSDAAWLAYAGRLIVESQNLLKEFLETIEALDSAGMSGVYAERWQWFKRTSITTKQADDIVAEISYTIGLESLDATRFRRSHFTDWQRAMRQLTHGKDPETHLRLLIQADLVEYSQNLPPPVNGDDVMDALGLPPGPQVGRVLSEIHRLHHGSGGALGRWELLRAAADSLELPVVVDLDEPID